MGLRELGNHVSTVFSDHAQMDELADSFTSLGLDVRRLAFQNTYHRRSRAVGASLDIRSAARVAAWTNELNPDIVHFNLQNTEDGLDLVRSARHIQCPTIATVHVTRSMTNLGARAGVLRDWFSRRTYRFGSMDCIGISPTSANDLAQHLGRPINESTAYKKTVLAAAPRETPPGENDEPSVHVEPCVHVISNGVERPETHDRQRVRDEWRISPDTIVLGVIARIEEQKNPLFMVELLSHLPMHVHCVWIGDGRLRTDLETSIAKAGLDDRFHLLGWKHEAAAFLSGFDLFVLPSLYEGLPLAILEAMSVGLTCVVSDVDGTRDAVEDDVTGRLCQVNSVGDWLQKIGPLIETQERRMKLGANAMTRHQNEFSRAAMAKKTQSIYEHVISKHLKMTASTFA